MIFLQGNAFSMDRRTKTVFVSTQQPIRKIQFNFEVNVVFFSLQSFIHFPHFTFHKFIGICCLMSKQVLAESPQRNQIVSDLDWYGFNHPIFNLCWAERHPRARSNRNPWVRTTCSATTQNYSGIEQVVLKILAIETSHSHVTVVLVLGNWFMQ